VDRLRAIEIFIAVAEAGSLAGAARRLRLSPPAVTRAVAALEGRLGARVFNRTTRSLSLTDAGRNFLERARRVVADLDAAERESVGDTALPQGHLRITAPVTFGRDVVAPVVRAFLAAQPRTSASLLLLDRVASLVDEGLDIAIRIGDLPDSSLVARRVGTVRRVLVASPRYLARQGAPGEPADLKRHALIAFTGLSASHEWRFDDRGKRRSVTVEPHVEFNDAVAALAAAEAGEGITIALSYMVATKLKKKKLVTVLDEMMPPPVPVHLVHAESRLVAPKLRAFVDFAAPRLAGMLDRLAIRAPRA
jgi:DNA-binding transcriptional LysR family regulator